MSAPAFIAAWALGIFGGWGLIVCPLLWAVGVL